MILPPLAYYIVTGMRLNVHIRDIDNSPLLAERHAGFLPTFNISSLRILEGNSLPQIYCTFGFPSIRKRAKPLTHLSLSVPI